ncbi:arylsulfotransferase family protein [Georgenia sp. TF02-10]|uniref:arylsulfotransferase family protein n=1 Tax=Georgenia sp. TF02-10 TaxID=2917725 RepID=UPI001FA80A5C|nr:arylsulfotransferase family protein [Georgenia sp. TF02-10]UNX54942.1 arylsulfotransferase family protein [Georgenia sp. TF02-10]
MRITRPVAVVAAGLALLGGAGLGVAQLVRTDPPEPTIAAVDASAGDVSAFPVPGTATVHPRSQLSFRGVAAADLGEVAVVGSESGEHSGSRLPHSDGAGVSFVPDEPFAEGEEVRVTTAQDVRGAEDGDYTVRVAVLGDRPRLPVPPVQEVGEPPADGEETLAVEHVRQYASAPGINPPVVDVTGPKAGTAPAGEANQATPGLTALGVKNGYGQKGPMLVDDAGEPVWFRPLTGVDARDVTVQTLAGAPVLTWWEGRNATGYGYGEAVVVDTAYEEVARVRMVGYDADPHEALLTADGTMLLLAYEPVRMDLSRAGGPTSGQVIDNIVQEIDLETGAVLFEWHSVGAVGLAESYLPADDGPRFDYFHLNSIAVDDDSSLLLSARHTCAVYDIDRVTGSVHWRLGGRESDFALGEGAGFLKQHDARRGADGSITLFDNGGTCGPTTRESSRGLVLDVDESAMTAELVREYPHPEGLFAESQGSFQQLPDGDVLLGWGSLPRFTLMSGDGAVRLDGAVPKDLQVTSYRARRVEWTGRPRTDPAAVVADGAVAVSWNGATEVAAWRVRDASGTEVAAGPREGFETRLPLPAGTGPDGLAVEALDDSGAVLGRAAVGAADD